MGKLLEAPLKRFLRNPNATRDYCNKTFSSNASLSNTVSILKDPENKRQLVLVGTLNSSDLLAQRTKNLLKEINPDSLLV